MSFDLLAPHYRWLEFLLAGEKLQRCRTAFLPDLPPATNILLLGEGNGRFLPACCHRFPHARITSVDASPAMLAQSRRRLAPEHLPRVSFVPADALTWTPPAQETYDLIVTNFFLDCFRPGQLEPLIRTLARAATKDAHWLLADFQLAPHGLARFRGKIILRIMYAFFRIATRLPANHLTPPDPFLHDAGFTLHRRTQSEWGLLHSDWWRRTE